MDPGLLLDQCPDVLSHHRVSGVFEYASAAAARVFGRPARELVGASILDLAAEEDRSSLAEGWSKALAEGAAAGLRFRVARGGTTAWVETNVRALESGAICSTRDVTDQVQKERELEDRAARAELGFIHWQELVAQIPGIVWFAPMREDGTRESANFISDYLERVTGYTPHEWLTTPNFWPSIIHPDDLDATLAATARALRDGSREPGPAYRVRAKDGRTVYFQSFMRVRRRPDGKPERLYGLTLDVTTFKEAEAKNAALLDDVRRASAEREALLGELARRADEILALSAPILPLGKGALVMPIIGAVDAPRGKHIVETLLRYLRAHEVNVAILDVTGVPKLDHAGASALVRAARAAKLLGADVVFTGLRAEAARAMIELGLGLEDLPTRSTLVRAVAEFLRS